jgi:glycosyltransferase involved in cell wall biosynthesis
MDVLLQAFASVRRAHPGVELEIVGEGPERAQVEGLVRELELDSSVRLLGDRDDVPSILSRASCFVLASDYEGCPLTVIEAMAAGVPVVATGVGGVAELVSDGRDGLVVDPGSPEALAAGLVTILGDPHGARRMGDQARRTARERFSRARMAEKVRALYESLG